MEAIYISITEVQQLTVPHDIQLYTGNLYITFGNSPVVQEIVPRLKLESIK